MALREPQAIEKLEWKGSDSVVHADFPLYTYAIQEWPSGRDTLRRIASLARAITSNTTRWTEDRTTYDAAIADLEARRAETHALLLAHGVPHEGYMVGDGGPWKPVSIIDRGWNPTLPELLPAIASIYRDAPSILWIRRETGRRKWNLRVGRQSALRIDAAPDPSLVDIMRAAARDDARRDAQGRYGLAYGRDAVLAPDLAYAA